MAGSASVKSSMDENTAISTLSLVAQLSHGENGLTIHPLLTASIRMVFKLEPKGQESSGQNVLFGIKPSPESRIGPNA